MIAVFLVLALTLVLQALLAVFPVLFHVSNPYLLLGPIGVVAGVVCLETFEAMWGIVVAGIVLDILTTNSSGAALLATSLTGAIALLTCALLGKPHWPMLIGLLLGVSWLDRIILSYFDQLSWASLMIGPLLDCFFGILVFYCLPKSIIKID
ncbi:MAG: hypothetical protein I8H75_04090 [Myxococcaceae bacterium]|nr:hypothetical protein [Myxococcaceae bacterium]MBH2006508.1 hypothetical protein [Myxococcaceae bacterium]